MSARIESPGGYAFVGRRAGRSGPAFDEPQRTALCGVRRHHRIFGRYQSEDFSRAESGSRDCGGSRWRACADPGQSILALRPRGFRIQGPAARLAVGFIKSSDRCSRMAAMHAQEAPFCRFAARFSRCVRAKRIPSNQEDQHSRRRILGLPDHRSCHRPRLRFPRHRSGRGGRQEGRSDGQDHRPEAGAWHRARARIQPRLHQRWRGESGGGFRSDDARRKWARLRPG